MKNHEITNLILDLECELFHKWSDMEKGEEREAMKEAHKAMKQALIAFTNAINK